MDPYRSCNTSDSAALKAYRIENDSRLHVKTKMVWSTKMKATNID
jgi:hypothetical protein